MRHEGKLERPHVLRKTRRVQTRPKNNRKVEKRPGARKVENREKQTNRKGSCFYFLILFCCFWCFFVLTFIVFLSVCEKRKAKKRKTLFFYLLGFWCFSFFSVFFLIFLDPKRAQTKKIPNVTSNRLRKNGNLDFFFLNHEVFWCSKCWSNPIRSEKSNSFSRWRTFWRRPWCQ